jgi:hypothetical protein
MSNNRLEVPWPVGTQAQVELLPRKWHRRHALRRRLLRAATLLAAAGLLAATIALAYLVPRPW